MRFLVILAAALSGSAADTYAGYLGSWVSVVATAYSPNDGIDSHYHETKGERWRWITADGRTDVRQIPYGIAVPLVSGHPAWKFGTRVIIPPSTGYVPVSRPDRIFPVDDVGNGKEYFKSKQGRLHIDLRFKTTESAIKWAGPSGHRTISVFIISRPVPILDRALLPEEVTFTNLARWRTLQGPLEGNLYASQFGSEPQTRDLP